MNRAVIYCRVSSEEQVSNFSLANQEKICREYCHRNDLEVVRTFIEPGESAKTANRPEFRRSLDFCRQKQNGIKYFVVYSLSRFCRNTEDHVTVAAMLRKFGVNIRSTSEPIDESHMGRFMENVLASVAELDNGMRAQACLDGLKSALDDGQWPFLAPLGYLNVKSAAGKPSIVIDPERGPLIKQGFQEFASGLHTQEQVLAELTTLGLHTKKGHEVTKQTFNSILRNPFYTGWMTVSKWEDRKKGNFDALIDEATFDKVKAVLTGRHLTVTPHVRNRPDFPLRGFAKCVKCGAPMTGGWSTGHTKRYRYYHCSKHCRGMGIRAEVLEGQFLEVLSQMRMKTDLVDLFNELVLDVWQQRRSNAQELAAKQKRRLTELEGCKQRLIEAHVYKQSIDEATFREQSVKLENEIAAVRLQTDAGQVDDLQIKAVLEFARFAILNAESYWQELPLDQKQRFQRVLTPAGITVDNRGLVGTSVTCPIFSVLDPSTHDKSRVVELIVSSWNCIFNWLQQVEQLRQSINRLPAAA